MMTLIQPFQPNPKLPCKNAKKGENDKNPHHLPVQSCANTIEA